MTSPFSITVVVSRRVRGFLTYPEDTEERRIRIFTVDDPIEKVFEVLRGNDDVHTGLLLFLSLEEISLVQEIFEGFSSDSVTYFMVAVALDRDAVFNPAVYQNLLGYRSTTISEDEFDFFTGRVKAELERIDEGDIEKSRHSSSINDALDDQDALIRIGKSLSLERNQDKLLRTILYLSKKITGADAGSLFLLEGNGDGEKRLRFKYSHTFSIPLHYEEFTLPCDTSSIAGYVAVTGKVLNIEDVYRLSPHSPISFNRSFDREHGYRTKSMLVVPMRGTSDQIIGVIQLINSKEGKSQISGNEAFEIQLSDSEDFEEQVTPFKKRYEDLMEAVAGQAAIAIENNRMLKQIEEQFDSFVRTSVMAIESRDPATHGHSFRVAAMTTRTAEAINDINSGPLGAVHFTPSQLKTLEFAGLLHDYGKVYIDPAVFVKGKKLYPKDYENLKLRHHLILRSLDCGVGVAVEAAAHSGNGKNNENNNAGKSEGRVDLSHLLDRKKELERIRSTIMELNEPRVRDYDPSSKVEEILDYRNELLCTDPEGNYIPLLTDDEAENLRISRGSLNPREREIIESHVEYGYRFVKSIPWPDEYAEIPEIIYGHHEKIDGSGYPRGVKGKEILPVGARIMAIVDIYDALAASDRPYKKALPHDKVISILKEEAEAGKLDTDLLEVFISSEAFSIPDDLRPSEQTHQAQMQTRLDR